jgi:hypothetical protein
METRRRRRRGSREVSISGMLTLVTQQQSRRRRRAGQQWMRPTQRMASFSDCNPQHHPQRSVKLVTASRRQGQGQGRKKGRMHHRY